MLLLKYISFIIEVSFIIEGGKLEKVNMLPKDFQDPEEQKQMLNSLSIVLQQSFQSLHAVIDKEPLDEEEIIYPVRYW